ncbi:hypothetical protein HOU02_gp144 [Caulobacter phage CcrBL9]|uniref:Uncharacterized protein n=1 Tax=Caulobacter phage CcrBL9 TaxID=2283270 RepID=A0A385ECH1_9CAUD|nr:hypothetical protein HOU02_gp041 [Caulobacter phage CcrBL9]YP_009810211.1 hypothetical protein HOU02_gp144 [Caulobacter phage CcrBL9]AXQ69065.1 hypothetical protein CcrBL9_gp041 [Caulobacter phage CcrBL9]AXQ69581.1 hypothetical protein CcrBL9_gp557 [Caulobacter phage CcrBL9]
MTHFQRATEDQVTVAHHTVSGGELTVTTRPLARPVYRLNGFKISAADAARKLAA